MIVENQIIYKSFEIYFDNNIYYIYYEVDGFIFAVEFDDLKQLKEYIDEQTELNNN